MKRLLIVMMVAVLVLLGLIGCAAGPNELVDTPRPEGKVAGFWQGLWHGIIAPITFVISLFNHNVSIYEVHNNGGWYNFGFIIGLTTTWGGGGSSAARARRRRAESQVNV